MDSKDLLKAIGDIDDKYLTEQIEQEKTNQHVPIIKVAMMKKLKYVLIPAFIVIIAVICINQNNFFKPNTNISKKEWKIKEIYRDNNIITDVFPEISVIPKWEEKTITQKFYSVNYQNTTYNTSRGAKLSSDKIAEKLGLATLNGYDSYTKTNHSINATLYKVANFSEKCVIAVQFEGNLEYYAYINPYYRPATLGEFMEDLNLKDIVSFGTVYYSYGYTDSNGNKQYEKIEFYDVSNEAIWQMLFNDFSLENIYHDSENYTSDYLTQNISISVNIPLLGLQNISVSLTDKGYLLTNILETGKGFYIGEDKVQEFIDYIIENYDGYKIVYVDQNGNEIIDANTQTPENIVEDIIMVTENTLNGYITKELETNKITSTQNKTEPYIP